MARIAQGVGQAMWEQCYVDPASGQPLAGSFMDYGMPRADTLPSFKTEIAEVLSPTNPLGIKAGGEGGTTAGACGHRQRHRRCACGTFGVRDIRCRRRRTRSGRRSVAAKARQAPE